MRCEKDLDIFMSSAYLMLYVFGCYVCIYSETQTKVLL